MGAGMFMNPPLNGSATLPLPPSAVNDADVECTFTTRFESPEARALAKREGVTLELWSDIPADGRPVGHWGALSFVWVSEAEGPTPPPAGIKTLSLGPVATGPSNDADGDYLVCHFTGRFPTPVWGGSLRFSYTYRLVYPDGGIRWLGDYGSDGQLFVERRDSRVELAAPQGQSWTRSESGEYAWETGKKVDVDVGRLDPSLAWAVWAVGQDGHTHFYPTLSALPASLAPELLVFLPTTPVDALSPHQPLVLRTRSLTGLAISPSGSLTISYAGAPPAASLSLRTCAPGSRALRTLADDLLRALPGGARLVGVVPQSGCAVLAGPVLAGAPLLLSVLPLRRMRGFPAGALLSAADLSGLLPSGASSATLFAPATEAALALPDRKDEPVFLSCGPDGGQVVLGAEHALPTRTPSAFDLGMAVSFLTSHEIVHEPEATPAPETEANEPVLEESATQEPQQSAVEELEAQEVSVPAQYIGTPPTPITPTVPLAPIPVAASTAPTTPIESEPQAPSTPKRAARTLNALPSPPPTPGRYRSPAPAYGSGTSYFAALQGLDGVGSQLRRRAASVLSVASGAGAVAAEDVAEALSPAAVEEVAEASSTNASPPSGRALSPSRTLVKDARALYRAPGARSCVRWYITHLLRFSTLVFGLLFARVLGALGVRRGIETVGLNRRERSVSPKRLVEALAPEEEVKVEEPVPAPEDSEVPPATPTDAVEPTLALDEIPAPKDEGLPALPAVASELDLPPAYSAPAQAPEPSSPVQPAPAPALRAEVGKGPVALLVRAAAPLESGELLARLVLELAGEHAVPSVRALGDGFLLRLHAEAAGTLAVSLSA